MAVRFVVDRELPAGIDRLTLSYAFYDVGAGERNGPTEIAMAQAGHTQDAGEYYFPHGSRLPFFGSIALFILMAGAAATLNGAAIGVWVLGLGFILLFTLFFLWFGEVIRENQAGLYNEQVDRSFRMGMMWFIFSEVMFFAAFFGALFYARQLSIPWLGGEGAQGGHEPAVARTSRPAGRATARATSARATTAATRSSRPSACRRSTPRCCSPRASRSRSRTTR